jgi:two-component system, sensor histidine kinase PdtaS
MIRMLHMASWTGESARMPLRAGLSSVTRCRTAAGRWLLALAIWLVALTTRWLLDDVLDSGPFLTFLPAIALTTLFCGRWPALAVIAAAAVACDYLWLPPAGFAMEWPTTPVSLAVFILIALFELVLVDRMYRASLGDMEQRSHLESSLRLRETLFQEMRQRIGNQLHVITAMLEGSQIRIDRGAKAEDVLEQAIGRISSITYLQSIVDDKASYQRGLVPLLNDMLDHIFYDVDVAVQVRAAPVNLPDDRTTMICLIVIEAAMNSLKHIFRRRRGHLFAVELRRVPNDRLELTVWDDGPGFDAGHVVAASDGLGLSIMHGLAAELGGTLSVESNGGTTVKVEFAEVLAGS